MKTIFLLALSGITAATPGRANDEFPTAFRDVDVANWKTLEPNDAAARGEWWHIYGDGDLGRLISSALVHNADLQAAAARVEQARAVAGFARGSYWPQLGASASFVRERTSSATDNVFPESLTNTYRAPLLAAWEIDLFGRVRNASASARADAESSQANYEAMRLTVAADVAMGAFSLQAADREIGLLRDTLILRRQARDIIGSRLAIGTAAEIDVARADAEVAGAEAELAALGQRRSALQNSLAVLAGEPAPRFEYAAPAADAAIVPVVPPGLPAVLLERRPDIAAAERALVAAQARIGVAKAAFFPAISLTGTAGFASGDIDRVFQSDARLWSVGPSLYLPLFQGGRNRANLTRSQAAHDEAAANYRQRVLVALREVQDALTASRFLAEQSSAQARALVATRKAAGLAQTRYDAGLVSYFEVIDAQRALLSAQRALVQLEAQQRITSVQLIKALGGSWSEPES